MPSIARVRFVLRCAAAAIAGIVLLAVVLRLEQARPIFELERAGATVVRELDGSVRSVSFSVRQSSASSLRLISELTTITSLNLSGSDLRGGGLEHLARLHQLHSLDLSDTQCAPESLAIVAQLPALRTLHLRRCPWLTDAELEPLARMGGLECLLIIDAGVSDAGLCTLVEAPRLRQLSLDRCRRITDAGLRTLAERSRLQELSVDNCPRLTEDGVQRLMTLESLRSLSIRGIPMSRPALKQFAAQRPQTALTVDQFDVPELQPLIDLGARLGYDALYELVWMEIDNQWHDPQNRSPFSLANHPDVDMEPAEPEPLPIDVRDDALAVLDLVPELPALYLRNIPITDAALAHVSRMPHLRWLVLENVQITDEGLVELAALDHLETLWLKRVRLSGENIGALSGLPNLTELALLSDRITPRGIEQVAQLKSLEALAIGDVSGAAVVPFVAKLPNLRELAMVRATLTADDTRLLSTSLHLQQLQLVQVHLEAGAFAPLENMKALRALFLGRCQFDRASLEHLQSLRPDLLVSGTASGTPRDVGMFALPQRRRLLSGIPLLVPLAPAPLH